MLAEKIGSIDSSRQSIGSIEGAAYLFLAFSAM
jgi:hypothetical protein